MKLFRRIIAAVLCIALCLAMTGCYSEDKSWSAKNGEETAAIGIYIYYLSSAYSDAAALVPNDTEVLKATIEDKPAEEWIREKALDYMRSYFWVNDKIEELGLQLTDAELETVASDTATMYNYFGASLDEMGISKDSLQKAASEYKVKFNKLFDHYYGEGGEFEVSKDEIKEDFTKGKYSYGFMYSTTSTKVEDETVALTDEEKKDLTDVFERYKKAVDEGEMTLQECAQNYAGAIQSQNIPYTSGIDDLTGRPYPKEIVDNIKSMKAGETKVFEAGDQIYLLQVNDINADFESIYKNELERLNMTLNLKSDDFKKYISENAAKDKADIVINEKAVNGIKLSKFASNNMKMGTLAPETESTESSEAE